MSRTFAYIRVSTIEQDTAAQLIAIRQAGIIVEDHRVISETISGTVAAAARPEFQNLLGKLEAGDSLVVLKLDRLGRDTIDILSTINMLKDMGVSVRSLDLGGIDLSRAEGEFMLTVFAAFASMERTRIAERTREGLQRARAEGKALGRPVASKTTERVLEAKQRGLSQSAAARELSIGLSTVKRHWNGPK